MVPLENAVSYLWDFTEIYPTLIGSLEELTGLMFIRCSYIVRDTFLLEIVIGDYLWMGLANREKEPVQLVKKHILMIKSK